MEFLQLAADRYSVRRFKTDPVPRELIDKILKAGQLAPTACNNQPQKILVVSSAEGLEKLKRCTECHFNAPLAMIVCNDGSRSWTRPFDGKSSGDVDGSIVTTHLMLEAAELGLGSTWVMFFIPDAVKAEFALADGIEPVAILPMGYPADDAAPSPMHEKTRPMAELVQFV